MRVVGGGRLLRAGAPRVFLKRLFGHATDSGLGRGGEARRDRRRSGQDFGDVWWPPTLACLRDQETGGLYVFLEEAQRVFERHGEVPIRRSTIATQMQR